MGVTGHIGLAFDPTDEATAIAAVNGEHEGDEWLRHQTAFGLMRENFPALHAALQRLVAADASLAPLATAIIGDRVVGEGPAHPMCLYPADEVRLMAEAFARVGDAALERAINEARDAAVEVGGWFPADVPEAFRRLRSEIAHVAANGWSLIAFMF